MRIRLLVLCLMLFSFLGNSVICQSIEKLDPGTIVEIESIVNGYMPQLTGLSIAIIYDGEIAYAKGFGDRNPDGDDFTIYTKTPIASISKTITAVMAVRMIQEGDLGLNDEVMDFFPGQADFLDMTVRHLLTHQSGIAHYCSCPDGYDGPFNPAASLDVVIGCNTCMTPPGSGTLYTTFGTTLLGVIIDQVGQDEYGSSYTQLYQNWLRGPGNLGTLEPAFDNSDPQLANGHTESGGIHSIGNWDDIGWKLPAGGFISNVVDLARFGVGVLNNTFLTQISFNSMIISQTPSNTADYVCCDASGSGYGLGWRLAWNFDHPNFRIWHNGKNDHGYSTYFGLYPNRNAGIVLLCNEQNETDVLDDIRSDLQNLILCPSDRIFPNLIDWNTPNDFTSGHLIQLSNGISNNTAFTFDAKNEVHIIPGAHYPAGRSVVVKVGGCTYE